MDISQSVVGQLVGLPWWQAPSWGLGLHRKEAEFLSRGSHLLPRPLQQYRADDCLKMVLFSAGMAPHSRVQKSWLVEVGLLIWDPQLLETPKQ